MCRFRKHEKMFSFSGAVGSATTTLLSVLDQGDGPGNDGVSDGAGDGSGV